MQRSNARALAAGLTFRPLATTARDTLDYNNTRPEAQRKALEAGAMAGIAAEREAQVLTAWKASRGGGVNMAHDEPPSGPPRPGRCTRCWRAWSTCGPARCARC